MNFLPKDYEIPTESRYMKFEEGENRFRVLGEAIIGTEYWMEKDGERKPVRVKPNTPVPIGEVAINDLTGNPDIKHFWMFPVYNYKAKKVQLLELTQKTIMRAIKDLVSNQKWGDPKEYDIVVTRGKDGQKTSYTTMPDPKETLTDEIKKEYKDTLIDLNQIWKGEDPFKVNSEDVDPSEVQI